MGRGAAMVMVMVTVTVMVMAIGAHGLDTGIVETLAQYPEFSTFSRLLEETGVAQEVDNRTTITVLAVDNPVMDVELARLGPNVTAASLADMLRYHVLLDYLGLSRFGHIRNRSELVTTLFQTTGRARLNSGFVNITQFLNGHVYVGAPNDSTVYHSRVSKIVDEVPYDVSVVQLSSPIFPSGLFSPQVASSLLAPVPDSSADAGFIAPALPPSHAPAPSPHALAPLAPSPHPHNSSPHHAPSNSSDDDPFAPISQPNYALSSPSMVGGCIVSLALVLLSIL